MKVIGFFKGLHYFLKNLLKVNFFNQMKIQEKSCMHFKSSEWIGANCLVTLKI